MNIKKYMMRAIALSIENIKSGGGPFGAVIVKEDRIIGEGQNSVVTSNDPTAHAEIVAIRNACKTINSYDLSGSIIFASCEPCPMCLSAIWWSRIEKVYFGNTQNDASQIGFDDEEIYRELTRPILQRKLPLEQVLHDESIKVFEVWEHHPNKIMY
jgi:tRNA(Arg) A34 adenosine deaminase TadA